VTLCSHSFDLLTGHLRSARLGLMLALLNERVALRVRPGQPSAAPPGGDEPSLLTGALAGDAATVNTTPLMLALLKDAAAAAREAELAAAADAALDAAPDGKPLTKKARAALVRAAEKDKAAQARAAAATVEGTDVPLPDPEEGDVRRALDDLRARAAVDAAHPPSAVMFTFVNTAASLNAVALADDASLVVGGYADGSVRLHDVAAAAAAPPPPPPSSRAASPDPAAAVTHLRGHSGAVYAVDVGPGARLAFSGGADGTLRAWSVGARAPVAAYRGHVAPIWSVAACPRGAYVATGGADRAARVWCTERAVALRLLAGHAADVTSVAWHPNAHYVATGSDDATVRLWDVRSGGPARVFVRHKAPITALAFCDGGLSLASGDEDGGVTVWDLASAVARRDAPAAHAGAVWSLAWARGGGGVLASGGADDAVRVWDGGVAPPPPGGAISAAPLPGAASGKAGAAASVAALRRVAEYTTKATPVIAVKFSARNLLLCGGALTLR
jgi:transcription initiation factor TFIID subunit 5